MKHLLCIIAVCLCTTQLQADLKPTCTGNPKTKVANFGKTAMPLVALGVALIKQDYWGALQSQIMYHGFYFLGSKLSKAINKKRPCGCGRAFPSGHVIAYATPSVFMHKRYGLKYGVPMYIASAIFAYDRHKGKSHSIFDLVATFAIAGGATWFLTKPFKESGAKVSLQSNGKETQFFFHWEL